MTLFHEFLIFDIFDESFLILELVCFIKRQKSLSLKLIKKGRSRRSPHCNDDEGKERDEDVEDHENEDDLEAQVLLSKGFQSSFQGFLSENPLFSITL